MGRVLIVSNRLPVTVKLELGGYELARSVGGLATGLAGVHASSDGWWIGWPGRIDGASAATQEKIRGELREQRLEPVALAPDLADRFYESFSNGVLWPLFHSLVDNLPLSMRDYEAYEEANRTFADAIVRLWQPGDTIWVHDYHLLLLPQMLRERLPDARIGFFLHIPFPASPILRVLPHREHLLEGMLGADLIGFHTPAYMRHFAASLLRMLGVEIAVDHVAWQGRVVRVGTFPMGVDAPTYSKLAEDPKVLKEVRKLRKDGAALLVGIDRLDYTKGIPRRLLALEELLRREPRLRGRIRLIQVAVPSRTTVQVYRMVRETIDELVGRIHGTFATPNWVPVHYLYRALDMREVTALYRAADVMLVTPIRDGMNLVAKEFVAARNDEDGVLILSEFAGASSELGEALMVNPYDVDAVAVACNQALTMPREERRRRMRSMRERVFDRDMAHWTASFLGALERIPPPPHPELDDARELERARTRIDAAQHSVFFLDYDGTLVPFVDDPAKAKPDEAVLELLDALIARPGTEVHIVSGRQRTDLERWFGHLQLGLHAEHGLWSRASPDAAWTCADVPSLPERDSIAALLADYAGRTPGAWVEVKTHGFAWHWRQADQRFGAVQANELRLLLTSLCANQPIAVHAGANLVEVRPYGQDKGSIARMVLARAPAGALAVALGDDRTDEDLFGALSDEMIAIHVGGEPRRAPLRLDDWQAARAFLRTVVAGSPVERA